MKFSFKKIASVLTSAVMLSSTVAMAAAANFPSPFVQNGVGQYAVVYGANAVQGTDNVAAATINSFLSDQVDTNEPAPVDVNITGENHRLDKSSARINLGDSITTAYTSMDETEFPVMLAEGIYENSDGIENDYSQKFDLYNFANLTFFADNDLDENEVPVVGFHVADSSPILTYTLDFSDTPTNTSMTDTYINILGKQYYVSKVEGGDTTKITLLDGADTQTVYQDEPVTVGDYTVELVSVDESDTPTSSKTTLKVNGNNVEVYQGSSKKIATDTYLSVTNINEATRESDKHYVEFNIGSGKIILENGQNVEVNEEDNEQLNVSISKSTNQVDKINIEWIVDEEQFLVPGQELVMPVFGVKVAMTGFQETEPEELSVKYSGNDYMYLSGIDLPLGTISSLPILYSNASAEGYNGTGKNINNVLYTSTDSSASISLYESKNTMFVATYENGDEWESYVFQLESVSKVNDKNSTQIKELSSGKTYTFTTAASDTDEEEIGNINLEVTASQVGGNATVTVTKVASGGTLYLDRLVTKGGLEVTLPVDGSSVDLSGNNVINFTAADPTSINLNFTEANEDNDVALGSSFITVLGFASEGPQVSSVVPNGLAVDSDSDDSVSRVNGYHASKIVLKDGDQDTADITYYADQAYADVFVVESSGSSSSNGGNGGNAGTMLFTDAQINSVGAKNLIVVGGSCVNAVAAKLLGSDTPLCESAWVTASGNNVGSGALMIKTFNNPYSTGKIATLVAGYDAADTANAVNELKSSTTIDTTVGTTYVKRASSTLQLVTS